MKCGIFILTVLFLHSFQVSDGGRFGKKCSGHGSHHSPQSNHIPPHLPSHQGSHHGSHSSHPGHHGNQGSFPSHPSENEIPELTESGSGSGQDFSSNEDPNNPPWNQIQYCDKPSNGLNCFGCFGGGSSKRKPKKPKPTKVHGGGPRCKHRFWKPTPPPDWDLPSANEVV